MFEPSLTTFDAIYGLVPSVQGSAEHHEMTRGEARAADVRGACEDCGGEDVMHTVNLVMRILNADPANYEKTLALLRTTLFGSEPLSAVNGLGERRHSETDIEGSPEDVLDAGDFYTDEVIVANEIVGNHEPHTLEEFIIDEMPIKAVLEEVVADVAEVVGAAEKKKMSDKMIMEGWEATSDPQAVYIDTVEHAAEDDYYEDSNNFEFGAEVVTDAPGIEALNIEALLAEFA